MKRVILGVLGLILSGTTVVVVRDNVINNAVSEAGWFTSRNGLNGKVFDNARKDIEETLQHEVKEALLIGLLIGSIATFLNVTAISMLLEEFQKKSEVKVINSTTTSELEPATEEELKNRLNQMVIDVSNLTERL